jgi:hypothetical protein
VVEGFSRPDWKSVRAYIKDHVANEDWGAAWDRVALRWLEELAGDLGGASRVRRSQSFFCLSDLEENVTRTLLHHAEAALEVIRGALKEAAWTGYHGKHVLLLFSDDADYFAYISYFYPEGRHVLTAGVFIRRGYAHIALPGVDLLSTERTLAHELVHNLLCHLPIPLWLNEGLAVVIQGMVARQRFVVDRDLAERHYQHWTEANIQGFWAGKSYGVPGDASELSYSLGEILVHLLADKGPAFIQFVQNADWRDAGQDAALNFLNLDLGEVLGGFLGPGNWRPQRKAIAECLTKEKG